MECFESRKIMSLIHQVTNIPDVLIDHYKEMGLTEKEAFFLIVLLRYYKRKQSVSIKSFIRESAYKETDINAILPLLVDKGFIALNEKSEIILDPLPELLLQQIEWLEKKKEVNFKNPTKAEREDEIFAELYSSFEQEMGRPLSPIEGEQIRFWYRDCGYEADVIKESLKRAVLLQRYNFRYIESILSSWQKNNLHSVEDILSYEERRKEKNNPRPGQRDIVNRSFRGDEKNFEDELYEI